MTRIPQQVWSLALLGCALVASLAAGRAAGHDPDAGALPSGERDEPHLRVGRRLFEEETFRGNGRTCLTCHSRETGTVSAEDARQRFAHDARAPLFLGDGSDDGEGNGVDRMLTHATVLVNVPLAENVKLAGDPTARTALVRSIPTTINSPALDPVLMWDGRHHTLDAQAEAALQEVLRAGDRSGPRRRPGNRTDG
jgi:cytochrome c peroxidase